MDIKIPHRILAKGNISTLRIYSDPVYIRSAQEFVLYYARLFGFTDDDLFKLELATEEAVLSIIENSFDEGEFGSFEISIGYKPGSFIISIDDKGIPTDTAMLERKENAALSLLLIRNLADEFRIINLGREGKRTELVKYLPDKGILGTTFEEPEVRGDITEADVSDDKPVIRLIRAEDVSGLCRLAYRVYGYTYATVFYYPEKISELIDSGLLQSVIAVNRSGEIVGNLSLFFEFNGARVADSGAAMVEPRYRGHSLFKNMKLLLKSYAVETGMYGIYSEAIAVHPFTQKGNLSLGAKETGIMLAYTRESITFKKINDDNLNEQRQSVVLFYLKTNQEPHRVVYLHEKFFEVLSKIYRNVDLNRDIIMVRENVKHTAEDIYSEINTTIKPDFNIAVISVIKIGRDASSLIIRHLRELCIKKIETIYVEIPVDDLSGAVLTYELNNAGFMLCGIVPELRNGDVLKMQYLNNVFIDPAKIVVVSDLTRELLDAIMVDYR